MAAPRQRETTPIPASVILSLRELSDSLALSDFLHLPSLSQPIATALLSARHPRIRATQLALEAMHEIAAPYKYNALQVSAVHTLSQDYQAHGFSEPEALKRAQEELGMEKGDYDIAQIITSSMFTPTQLQQLDADTKTFERDIREEEAKRNEIETLRGGEKISDEDLFLHAWVDTQLINAAEHPRQDVLGTTSNDLFDQAHGFKREGVSPVNLLLRIRAAVLDVRRLKNELSESEYGQARERLAQQQEIMSRWEQNPQMRKADNLAFRAYVYTLMEELPNFTFVKSADIAKAMIARSHLLAGTYTAEQLTNRVAQTISKIRNETGQASEGSKTQAAQLIREQHILAAIEAHKLPNAITHQMAEQLLPLLPHTTMSQLRKDLIRLSKLGRMISHKEWVEQQILEQTEQNKGIIPLRLQLAASLGVGISTVVDAIGRLRQPDENGLQRLPDATGNYATTDLLLQTVPQILYELEQQGIVWRSQRRGNSIHRQLISQATGLSEETIKTLFANHGNEINALLQELRPDKPTESAVPITEEPDIEAPDTPEIGAIKALIVINPAERQLVIAKTYAQMQLSRNPGLMTLLESSYRHQADEQRVFTPFMQGFLLMKHLADGQGKRVTLSLAQGQHMAKQLREKSYREQLTEYVQTDQQLFTQLFTLAHAQYALPEDTDMKTVGQQVRQQILRNKLEFVYGAAVMYFLASHAESTGTKELLQ